jgi:predicted nucleic acid-binding protein
VPDVWVVNASPLIALDRIDCVHLLGQLATEVVLPAAVIAEVAAGPHPLGAAQLGRHRSVVAGAIHPVVAAWDLGAGETEVVSWAASKIGSVAILDDRAARRCAAALGVPTVGTLRVLLHAKKAGLIAAVAPLIDGLRRSGIYLSDTLIADALKLAGESA